MVTQSTLKSVCVSIAYRCVSIAYRLCIGALQLRYEWNYERHGTVHKDSGRGRSGSSRVPTLSPPLCPTSRSGARREYLLLNALDCSLPLHPPLGGSRPSQAEGRSVDKVYDKVGENDSSATTLLPAWWFAPLPIEGNNRLYSPTVVTPRKPGLTFILITLVLDVLGIGLIILSCRADRTVRGGQCRCRFQYLWAARCPLLLDAVPICTGVGEFI